MIEPTSLTTHASENFLRVKYTVVGAGPASIMAIVRLIAHHKISPTNITWVSPHFNVGDFGSILSKGSSVPGNTTVEAYQKTFNEIYLQLPNIAPTQKEFENFTITRLAPQVTCSLKIASEPLQAMSNKLVQMVKCIKGTAQSLNHLQSGWKILINTSQGMQYCITEKAILGIGARPKSLELPKKYQHINLIDPNTVFIKSELDEYLQKNPQVKTMAVIGSSHSAALATMHLLQAKVQVKQFMNKEYKFAELISVGSSSYTQYDNTGLKGEVAQFTKQLLHEQQVKHGQYYNRYELYIDKNIEQLLEEHLSGCSHAIVAIGYEVASAIKVNGKPLTQLKYDTNTTEIIDYAGLYVIGIGHPQLKITEGEKEFLVGVTKFWATVNSTDVNKAWQKAYPNYDVNPNIFFKKPKLELKTLREDRIPEADSHHWLNSKL